MAQGVKGTSVGQAERQRRYRERYPERVKAQRAKSASRQAEYGRNYWLSKRYGITTADFDAMLAKQLGRCAICATDEPGGMGSFHVDHDHVTGAVRGLLCYKCNQGLGFFNDNPRLLQRARRYLDA